MESNADKVCINCMLPEDRQDNPAFQCRLCNKLVHLRCITGDPPSPLFGDVLFEFTCASCSKNQVELFVRSKMTWAYVLILTLNHLHLTSQGIGNQGFFHYRTHIACFIDRNWTTLFGNQFKQKKNWIGTLVGVLSHHSGIIFQSSGAILGEQGWWRLMYKFSPALAVHMIQEMARDKAMVAKTKRYKENIEIPVRTIQQLLTESGYEHLLQISDTEIPNIPSKLDRNPNPVLEIPSTLQEGVPRKKRRVDSKDSNGERYYQTSECNDSDSSYDFGDNTIATGSRPESSEDSVSQNYSPSTSLGFKTLHQELLNYDSDSQSRSPPIVEPYSFQDDYEAGMFGACEKQKEESSIDTASIQINETSLFSKELNSVGKLPWLGLIEKPDKCLTRLTEYEEIQLLKRVESMIPELTNPTDKTYLRRLRAKLALRRLKRNKHIPLFDLDNTVKYLGGYSTEDPRVSGISKEQVLDRFQASYMCGLVNSLPATILVGNTDHASFQSPYSGTVLKPFIRRDVESSPLWLRVMDELLQKTNKNNPDYVPTSRAPIDYSYVKPQHVAAVNNLCTLFFWQGIDISESLQYPEFSCVVTYKKLVIGFAFLVPDVARNTAYISFVLVRPEWRHSKIATFMLYHLLQTCTGQDVTLHVSPTNPAVFLYQKFGFKVEELVQDFYEKYFEVNSKVCKHALLLRLTR